ncbi:MAG TPA: permease-like cell division protein FtsX [Mycobacteriales bacterium]|nr:permease-like cell division protein FtsX [Mycobacteriales bacterium]
MSLRRKAVIMLLLGVGLAGCGGGGSSPQPGARSLPDIDGFLSEPVATPSTCTSQNATTFEQRKSPWVGHIDVSVFLSGRATSAATLGQVLRRSPIVKTTYFESSREAYAEFQRLYTCWAAVPRSQTPASFRVILKPTATIAQRDSLVARIVRHAGVDSVSCDPALPCTEVVQSAAAQRR